MKFLCCIDSFGSANKGFTLVELSIILVIMGLLSSAVVTGQHLIHASELRSISVEYDQYRTAVITFKEKYFSLPGDIPNATAFWGIAAGNGSNNACIHAVHEGRETCNGNGDGSISGTFMSESQRTWQHMSNASIIPGSYSGGDKDNVPYQIGLLPGYNMPESKYSGANNFWWLRHGSNAGSSTSFFVPSANYLELNEGLIPEDAWNIDQKLDDGVPNTGTLMASKGSSVSPCTDKAGVTPSNDSSAQYSLDYIERACFISFKMQ